MQGTFTATVAAADDVGVAGVQFLLDGVGVGGEDTSPPFTATIDTYRYPEGLHTLTAVARDTFRQLRDVAGQLGGVRQHRDPADG